MTEEARDNRQDDEQPGWMVASGRELMERFGFTAQNRPTITLDPENVPEALRVLIPYAEAWGISDDLIRGDVLDQASPEALSDLVATVGSHDEALNTWLGGSEASSEQPTEAYIAFSALVMAFDEASYR